MTLGGPRLSWARPFAAAAILATFVVVACGAFSLGDEGAGYSSGAVTATATATAAPASAVTPATAVAGPRAEFNTVAVQVELAVTPAERARGLGGHAPLGEREGMLFIFEQPGIHSFWMKGMTFPLDILWIEGGRVVHLEQNLPPPGPTATDATLPVYSPSAVARYVLEVNAGFSRRYGIGVGSAVQLTGLP